MHSDTTLKNIILDFDSTIVQLETLDELAKIVLRDKPDAEAITSEIAAITARGMNGEIGFAESLAQRLAIMLPSKAHMETMQNDLIAALSPSFLNYREQITQHADNIWIVSGGFKELIVPVAQMFSISPNHILANDFIWDKTGQAIGYDHDNLLSQNDGKIMAVRKLGLQPDATCMIGDGMTDYAIRAAGLAGVFIAYTETCGRPAVIEKADFVAANFDELARIIQW